MLGDKNVVLRNKALDVEELILQNEDARNKIAAVEKVMHVILHWCTSRRWELNTRKYLDSHVFQYSNATSTSGFSFILIRYFLCPNFQILSSLLICGHSHSSPYIRQHFKKLHPIWYCEFRFHDDTSSASPSSLTYKYCEPINGPTTARMITFKSRGVCL